MLRQQRTFSNQNAVDARLADKKQIRSASGMTSRFCLLYKTKMPHKIRFDIAATGPLLIVVVTILTFAFSLS